MTSFATIVVDIVGRPFIMERVTFIPGHVYPLPFLYCCVIDRNTPCRKRISLETLFLTHVYFDFRSGIQIN